MKIEFVMALFVAAAVFALIFRSFWKLNETSSKDDQANYEGGEPGGGGD